MICHNLRKLFLHPSKTGGSAVLNTLVHHELGLSPLTPFNTIGMRNVPVVTRMAYQVGRGDFAHMPLKRVIEIYPFVKDWPKVMTIRHPYDRAISEFRYQIDGHRTYRVPAHSQNDLDMALESGDFWRACDAGHENPQADYYEEGMELLPMHELDEKFETVFGIPFINRRVNTSNQREIKLTDVGKAVIQDFWGADFELFGFTR